MAEPAGGTRPLVRSYGPGYFRVGEARHAGAILLLPDRVLAWQPAGPIPSLDDLAPFLALDPKPELLVLGTGTVAAMIPTALRMALREAGIALEAMPTQAACRTYAALVGEGRSVAAALLPV